MKFKDSIERCKLFEPEISAQCIKELSIASDLEPGIHSPEGITTRHAYVHLRGTCLRLTWGVVDLTLDELESLDGITLFDDFAGESHSGELLSVEAPIPVPLAASKFLTSSLNSIYNIP